MQEMCHSNNQPGLGIYSINCTKEAVINFVNKSLNRKF